MLMDLIRPPADNPEANARWQTAVSISIAITGLAASFAVFGPYRIVFAGEVDSKLNSAKAEISKQIKTVDDKVEAQGKKIDSIDAKLNDALAEGIASQIRLQISKRCKTLGAVEKEEYNREIYRLQRQYRAFKGEIFPEPSCSEL